MGKAEKSELSEILEQGLKLFQLRLFGFHLYAENEKLEMSEQRLKLFVLCVQISAPTNSFSVWKNLNFAFGSLGSTEWRVTHKRCLFLFQ